MGTRGQAGWGRSTGLLCIDGDLGLELVQAGELALRSKLGNEMDTQALAVEVARIVEEMDLDRRWRAFPVFTVGRTPTLATPMAPRAFCSCFAINRRDRRRRR